MILYPAIDLLGGEVVRLRQGEYGDSTVYGTDPVEVARGFVDAGATWVHMVDLDAARSGRAHNRGLIGAVAAAVAGRAEVQVGGGVRTVDDARELRDGGVARVVMGSAAVGDPSLVERVAAVMPVAVGLDHRAGNVATHGWTESSGRMVLDMLGEFPSASAFVITDISRDGMLVGPDVDGLVAAAAATGVPVIASGGVGTLAHLRALAAFPRLGGVIVGKAIYEGKFTVAEAVGVLS
jgi:phosphoribosylformimino-5-aminoimidazole carboxamide ribotide isomerase